VSQMTTDIFHLQTLPGPSLIHSLPPNM